MANQKNKKEKGIVRILKYLRNTVRLGTFIGKPLTETYDKEIWIETPSGRNIYAHVHCPNKDGVYPGVVIIPGGNSCGTDYDKFWAEIRAQDIASLGFVVLHYDPSGRGKSGGKEDYWGQVHQQELSWVVNYFSQLEEVKGQNIGIMSFSIGIIIATGALARFPMPGIKYLFDWEGPSNRHNITRNDTHKPLLNFHTSNDEFWKEREASSFIGNIKCGYFRYQAELDHVQGNYKGHAIELLNMATKGKAAWTVCNDNPVNLFFDESKTQEYRWVPPRLNHKGQILKYLVELQKEKFV